MIDALHNDVGGVVRDVIYRICRWPLLAGFLGAAAIYAASGRAAAEGFAQGALLVVAGLAASAAVYWRRSAVQHAGLMLFRLLTALAVKWAVVLGGAAWLLAKGGVAPGAFVAGIVAALLATLFGYGIKDETARGE